jgi:DNA-binding MarR family transcriptional regulator
MDRMTLTRNLRPLERDGLVSRKIAPGDGRVRLVGITADGRDRLREARGYWRTAQKRVLAMLGESEWRDLEDRLVALRRQVSGEN